jgi:hypothetical protein
MSDERWEMARRVLVGREGSTVDLVEVPAPSEHDLQEVLKDAPQLLPSDELGIDGDLMVIGRETSLASGYIDLLCLSRAGEVVLIEFKTGPQNPDFRHALAQLVDYGSDLWQLTVDEFDRGVVQRYLASAHVQKEFFGSGDLSAALGRSGWNLSNEDREILLGRLAEVLAVGDFHYVVAAQRFTPGMRATLDYLNATMRFGRFFLVEIIRLEGAGMVAHAAQVVVGPPRWSASAKTSASQVDEDSFLNGIQDEAYRDAVHDVLAGTAPLGLVLEWGSGGASIRMATPDRQEPLSIGWLLSRGAHWYGARHATFGVDPASLAHTPSVSAAVRRYVNTISQIPGATAVPSKSLNAYTFGPDTLPAVHTQILDALSQLLREVNGSHEAQFRQPRQALNLGGPPLVGEETSALAQKAGCAAEEGSFPSLPGRNWS